MHSRKTSRTLKDLKALLDEQPALKDAEQQLSQKSKPKKVATVKNNEERAAATIKNIWRKNKVRQHVINNPFVGYTSLIDPLDEQKALSELMYGRHQAEIRWRSPFRIKNPKIHNRAAYFRVDNISGDTLTMLLSEFNITAKDREQYAYYPITNLSLLAAKDMIPDSLKDAVIIKSNATHSVHLLRINFNSENYVEGYRILDQLTKKGLRASPWEITQNIKQAQPKTESKASELIDKTLPQNKAALLNSDMFKRLKLISQEDTPTAKLARSLCRLISNLDDTTTNPHMIQRIALMIDFASLFYKNNYPRFAYMVYNIIHEISLHLAKEVTPEKIDQQYDLFQTAARSTFLSVLGINGASLPQSNTQFFATPAKSGTNAAAIAIDMAIKMKTVDGEKPTINILKPCYYEVQATRYPVKSVSDDSADIFIASAGAIVNPDGIAPGIDINKFVKEIIIDKHRQKPTTIVLDCTTTLYKNLKLNEETKALIDNGSLSLIVFESHQKFGLLHTDEAQYGRVMGLYGKTVFKPEFIADMQEKSRQDFGRQLDMRIGAYIDTHCPDVLEDIKQQHFTNGAIFRNIMKLLHAASHVNIPYEYTQRNFNELYFATTNEGSMQSLLYDSVEYRNSFGHFINTISSVGREWRLCADASDEIDCLIQGSRLYLSMWLNNRATLDAAKIESKQLHKANLNDQITALAMAQNFTATNSASDIQSDYYMSDILEIKAMLSNILKGCVALRGRYASEAVNKCLTQLNDYILQKFAPVRKNEFLNCIDILYRDNAIVSEAFLKQLAKNREALILIASVPTLRLAPDFASNCLHDPDTALIVNNLSHYKLLAGKMASICQDADHPVNYNQVKEIITYENAEKILSIMIEKSAMIEPRHLVSLVKYCSQSVGPDKKITTMTAADIQHFSIITTYFPDTADTFLPLLNNDQFIELLTTLEKMNSDILDKLHNSPKKYMIALDYSQHYMKTCLAELNVYCSIKSPTHADKERLMKALETQKNEYVTNVLSKEFTFTAKASHALLVTVVNLFAALTLGIAHIIHYRKTNSVLFYGTKEPVKHIEKTHKEITQRHKIFSSPSKTVDDETIKKQKPS